MPPSSQQTSRCSLRERSSAATYGCARTLGSARAWLMFWVMLMLFPCGGATCNKFRPKPEFIPPVVFEKTPTLDELIAHLNRTTAVERLNSGTVTLSTPGTSIKLSGNLSWHRPSDFRLQAYPLGTRVMGDALDAGSNADQFWLLTKLPGESAMLYYASHQQFDMQPGPRRVLPVSPLWIREALGIIEFEPGGHHEGPIVRSADKLVEIRSVIPTHRGSYKRTVVVEPVRATVRQLILKDPEDKMVASATMSEHVYYSAIDASLPHRVDLQMQPDTGMQPDAGQVLAFTIEVGSYILNDNAGNEAQRYIMPESGGYQSVDLVQLNANLSQAAAPPISTPAHSAANPYAPIYR